MNKPSKTGGSGYTSCACRDCFDIAVSDDTREPGMCWECGEAGCEADSECSRDSAYVPPFEGTK